MTAFYIGNLKNRNLEGDLIDSQLGEPDELDEDSDSNDTNGELPAEEASESSDVELGDDYRTESKDNNASEESNESYSVGY